ncbi:hypothetical protein BGX27_005304, partial [Mortierella sp. AM989]
MKRHVETCLEIRAAAIDALRIRCNYKGLSICINIKWPLLNTSPLTNNPTPATHNAEPIPGSRVEHERDISFEEKSLGPFQNTSNVISNHVQSWEQHLSVDVARELQKMRLDQKTQNQRMEFFFNQQADCLHRLIRIQEEQEERE